MGELEVTMDVKEQSATFHKSDDETRECCEENDKKSNKADELDTTDSGPETLEDEAKPTSRPPCQFCSTIGVVLPAEVLCENCGYQYCYECLNTLHPRRGPFITHQLQRISTNNEVPVSIFLCPHHDAEMSPRQVQVYCVTCSFPVCFECTAMKGRHQHHKLRLIKEQATLKMEEVFAKVKKLQRVETDAKDDILKAEKSFEQLKFQYQQESLKIQQTCTNLHMKILEAETKTLGILEESFQNAKKHQELSQKMKEERLLDVQREIKTFDKVLHMNQNDASAIVISHEAKKAMESGLNIVTSNEVSGKLWNESIPQLNTALSECPSLTEKLSNLIRIGQSFILSSGFSLGTFSKAERTTTGNALTRTRKSTASKGIDMT